MIVDASDQVLGRISSEIAKILLKEKEVIVVNAEKIIVTGRPKEILERFRRKRKMGDPHHGPFYPKSPDKILIRSVRGMLPYKKPRGRDALKRLKVYIGNPNNLKGERIAKTKKQIECNYLTLKDISESI